MSRLSGSVVAVIAAMSVLAGCGVPDEPSTASSQRQPLTFEEFTAQAAVEPDTGIYVVNGDEMAEDVAALVSFYRSYLADYELAFGAPGAVARKQQRLIVNTVGGSDDVWSPSQAQSLTYCISKKDFGSNYQAVVNAMNAAAGAWELSANVNFVHDAASDGNCTNRTNVVFDVRRVCRGQYLARAFFPSTSRRSREVLIDCTSFGNISPWTLEGVLRHELGHTIGFRHEHTRPESGVCFEDNNWRALTAYDSSSVMHYPQCNGTQTGDLVLTNLDRQGAGALYP